MTTVPMAASTASGGRLNVLRCTLTGAAVSAVLFVICWLGALFSLPGASHLYLVLFTAVSKGTIGALAYGVISSTIVGLVTGALLAFFYNVFAIVERSR